MSLEKRPFHICAMFALVFAALFWACPSAIAQYGSHMMDEGNLKKVSEHVYVIMGNPNVGIVVGNRATLVVDTGMGPRNGATVARVAQKLSKGTILYLTTTHFHPEHATGLQGFPANTVLIRPTVQQEEMDKEGQGMIDLFSKSPENKELLQDVQMRAPDVLFDKEIKLDLGDVTARLFWLGPAHTMGDESIFVEEDSTLLPGDIVQSKMIPNLYSAASNTKNWVAILDKLEPLKARFIVPDHGDLGDATLIAQERAFLVDLRGRVLELKRQGKSAEEASKLLAPEFKTKYPDWTGDIGRDVGRVYAEPQ